MPKKDPETSLRRERFRDYCKSRGWDRADGSGWLTNDIAKAIGKPVNKTSDLLNGYGSFGSKISREIEDALNLPNGHFDGIGESEDFVDVRVTDVKAAAGNGSLAQLEDEEIGSLKFRRDFLRSCGVVPENASIIKVTGRSMEPTIKDGASLLVNKSNKVPHRNDIYVFWKRDEGLVVKRLVKEDGRWIARSDNDDRASFPDFALEDTSTVELIGKAVWMGSKL